MSCRNISPLEQIVRVLVAVFLIAYALIMTPPVTLGALLTLLGVLLIYTAFVEYCPLKEVLGLSRCRAVSVSGQTTKGKRKVEAKGKATKVTKTAKATKAKKAKATKKATKAKKTTSKAKKATAKKGSRSKAAKGKKAKK